MRVLCERRQHARHAGGTSIAESLAVLSYTYDKPEPWRRRDWTGVRGCPIMQPKLQLRLCTEASDSQVWPPEGRQQVWGAYLSLQPILGHTRKPTPSSLQMPQVTIICI